ncbi:MAG: hypothetical protein C0456_07375 [Hyphomonas sp.]|uniref:hypothetical protein n=1 Tax=Hyphomonas sp. TaxID=87 RepID=UPI001D55FD59|nr:hypothetical protein [Hyphomonas sp.]MBA4226438.1 hypothetical protein [Hyphomonas sp.]
MSNESITNTVVKSAKNTATAAAETFHDTAVAARTAAKDIGALAEAAQSDTKDGVRQLAHLAEDESSKVIKFVRQSLQERPNLTVGVVAGIGVLIGMMLSGRR